MVGLSNYVKKQKKNQNVLILPPFWFYLFFSHFYHFNTSHISEVYDVTFLRHHYISCNSLYIYIKKERKIKKEKICCGVSGLGASSRRPGSPPCGQKPCKYHLLSLYIV